jgi:hypothetical protein
MPLAIRLRALALALLFVGGTFVAPVVDGVLFHPSRLKAVARVHLERQGDQCHAERCLLDAPIAGTSLEATQPAPVSVAAEESATAVVRLIDVALSQTTPSALHSRAPPRFSA